MHLQRRDPDKALAHLSKALKWDPKFIQARNELATAHFMKGDYQESEKACRELLKDEPAFAPAWNNLALALFEQERFQEAAEALKKAEEGGFEVQDEFKKEVEAKAKA